MYYVYAYYEKDSAVPFYIGKGHGSRAWDHLATWGRNAGTAVANKVKSLIEKGELPDVEIVSDGLEEFEAFQIEKYLILQYGRRPIGPLLNLTDGGDGCSGRVVSDASKIKMRDAQKKYVEIRRQQMIGNKFALGHIKSTRRKIASYGPMLIKIYDYVGQVREDGYGVQNVCACLSGKRCFAYGLTWQYI